MPDLGPPELIIIFLILVLVFGGSKLADLGGSLGKGVKEFRSAIKEDDASAPVPVSVPPTTLAPAMQGMKCAQCGSVNQPGSRFCRECGSANLTASSPQCPKCHAVVPEGSRFCNECGATLTTTAANN